jgi:hypothetical protein
VSGEASELRVSPDGQNIVFIDKINGTNQLSTLDPNNGKITTIDLGLEDNADPSWSTDGTKIVFAGLKNNDWEIYLYDINDKNLQSITNDPKRKKSWPRFSPYKFNGNYRIAYVSEKDKRKDIWWVRESGLYDMPITQQNPEYDSSEYWRSMDIQPPPAITEGGDSPEWSPSGNLLLYRTQRGYILLGYNYHEWWAERNLPVPPTEGVLRWTPNQTAFLEFNALNKSADIIYRDNPEHKQQIVNMPINSICFFPDGRGFAYSTRKNNNCVMAIAPYDDPLGDVANLWMYSYSASQKTKMQQNQLLFLDAKFDQIYKLYDSERYSCGQVDPNRPARPYLVTSDAVLETFYAAFAALYDAMEHSELARTLKEFSRRGMEFAKEKNAPKDVIALFETGLALLDPAAKLTISSNAKIETDRVETASGSYSSLFGEALNYNDFFIRGKYERDTAMQGYFRSIRWYQAFSLNLDSLKDRENAAEIIAVANSPKVRPLLQKIYDIYRDMVGESRYYNPLNLKGASLDGNRPMIRSELPWIEGVHYFRLLPSIYTLDAHIFDELVQHSDRPNTVGGRLLPKGLDVMAGLGSDEAFKILINELHEGQHANYEKKLTNVRDKIRQFPLSAWNANLYQDWLYALQALVKEPDGESPSFAKTSAWKRKQLNAALGSWVNLRYETIAVVEQISAECGEGGYEQLNIGKPKGYVEPNPEFFHRLDEGFAKINAQLERAIADSALKIAALAKVSEYREHIQSLEMMAKKELTGEELTDEEYNEILEIGGVIEHFILIMGSLNGNEDEHAVKNPDPIMKIVDVQKDPFGNRLYEALGYADEINVAVPFYGRRQIVKGPVYSYYEFISNENLDSKKWRKMSNQTHPSWIEDLFDGNKTHCMPDQ